jgi:hypothetical protein
MPQEQHVEFAEGHNATAVGAMVSSTGTRCIVTRVSPRPVHGTSKAPASNAAAAAVSLLAPILTHPPLKHQTCPRQIWGCTRAMSFGIT